MEGEKDDVYEDIRNAIKEGEEEKETPAAPIEAEEPEPTETPEATEEPAPLDPAKELEETVEPPPQSWSAEAKKHWGSTPPEVRAYIQKREQDIHQMFTRHDGDLRLGREMNSVLTPYIPVIQAAGSTPVQAVNNLLNTAYKLRTGDAPTKVAMLRQIAQEYDIDLNAASQSQEYNDPVITQLQAEINNIKQLANPNTLKEQLRDQFEADKVKEEVDAFASDPANVYYPQVAGIMASLLRDGQARDMKEAYEMACHANPQIRSTLEAQKRAEQQAKRQAEIAAKKHAAASVTGSPAISNSSAKPNPKASVEDDLRAAFAELENRV